MGNKYEVGTKHMTNEGYLVEIVDKIDVLRRKVRFEDGYEVIVKCYNVGAGNIKNHYHPSVCGVGYMGVGEYKSNLDGKITPEYSVWQNMLQRCYDEKYQESLPTYKDVAVCEEWLNFQNFADFYHKNYPRINEVNFQLDKDLLQENIKNKIYSPETCIFLPKNINTFFTNKQSDNTSGYTGVSWHKQHKKWQAQIRLFGENKKKFLGCFTTPKLASEVYQQARTIEAEKVKEYLRSLNYLPEEIIELIR